MPLAPTKITAENIWDVLSEYSQPRDRVRPNTPYEVLDQALVMARDEQKWAQDWVELIYDTREANEYDLPPGDTSALSCTNVRACAMGLLILATFDGPFVRAYYSSRASVNENALCRDHPLIRVAGPILAFAMDVVNREMGLYDEEDPEEPSFRALTLEEYLSNPGSARDKVITINDTKANHEFIVRSFEEAVRVANQPPYNRPV